VHAYTYRTTHLPNALCSSPIRLDSIFLCFTLSLNALLAWINASAGAPSLHAAEAACPVRSSIRRIQLPIVQWFPSRLQLVQRTKGCHNSYLFERNRNKLLTYQTANSLHVVVCLIPT